MFFLFFVRYFFIIFSSFLCFTSYDEMKNDIKELKNTIKELVEMMKVVYEFEDA